MVRQNSILLNTEITRTLLCYPHRADETAYYKYCILLAQATVRLPVT